MAKVTIEEIKETWIKAIDETCRNNLARTYLISKQMELEVKLRKETLGCMLLLIVLYLCIAPIMLHYELYVGIVIFTILIICIKVYLDIRLDRQTKRLKERRYENNK